MSCLCPSAKPQKLVAYSDSAASGLGYWETWIHLVVIEIVIGNQASLSYTAEHLLTKVYLETDWQALKLWDESVCILKYLIESITILIVHTFKQDRIAIHPQKPSVVNWEKSMGDYETYLFWEKKTGIRKAEEKIYVLSHLKELFVVFFYIF